MKDKNRIMIDYHLESLAMIAYLEDDEDRLEIEKYIYENAPKRFEKYSKAEKWERELYALSFLTEIKKELDEKGI